MLYDQRWDAKTKAKPCSLEGLIAWLEMQPAETQYDWHDCKGGCLMGLYGAAIGYPTLTLEIPFLRKIFGTSSYGGPTARYARICGTEPYTFGAALTRARAVLTERAGA